MKIADVKTIALRMPMRLEGAPPRLVGGIRTFMDMLLVRIETDSGVIGWGEPFGNRIWPASKAAIDSLLAPAAIGLDAADIAGTIETLERLLNNAGRNGPATFGLSGIDIALWDIAAKSAGKPLHRLLSESSRTSLPVYASLLRYGDADRVGHFTAQAIERGYRQIKLHEVGVDEVRAARAAAGDAIPLMVDTNCPWTVEEAIEMSRRFAPCAPYWIEEPVWPPDDFDGLARVRTEGGVPIAAGENCGSLAEFRWMLRANAVDYVQPSIGKIGGVSAMRGLFQLAGTQRVSVVPHCTYFGPSFLATAHALAAWADEPSLERFYLDLVDSAYGEALQPIDGNFTLPEAPGLGIDPDPSAIARLRQAD